jgi:hypothetical protein
MTHATEPQPSGSRVWLLVLILLVAVRVPSIVQPAGGDQWLYSYVAHTVLDGGVPYRDAFEQKTPGIFAVYAFMWGFWPNESVVALADLIAALSVASLLWGLGGRMFGGAAGRGAAVLFLLLGDPAIQGLGGLNVRAQSETFIALAVTLALSVAWTAKGRVSRLIVVGALCGGVFWLKYNAVVYVLPVALAAGVLEAGVPRAVRIRFLAWMAAGGAGVVGLGLLYFAVAGALGDLWTGTVAYNLAYSGETYRSASHAFEYVVTLPIQRARVDGLWFIGGLGALAIVLTLRFTSTPVSRAGIVALAWIGACVASIAINGSRGLPQYFVQAKPALALAGAAGFALLWRSRAERAGRIMLAAHLARGQRSDADHAAPSLRPAAGPEQSAGGCSLFVGPD